MQTGPVQVRRRLIPALIGLVAFTALGSVADHSFWLEPWFAIGVGMAVSATFLEPFFTRPQDGIGNAAAASLIFFAVDRDPIFGLWLAYEIALLFIFALSLFAVVSPPVGGRLKWLANRVAAQFGKAVLIGSVALFLEILGRAARGEEDFAFLAAGAIVLIACLAVDWHTVASRVAGKSGEGGTAFAAVGPRMLLAGTTTVNLQAGTRVKVGSGGATTYGSIVARLPHREGLRYEIALDCDWSEICPSFPAEITIEDTGEPAEVVGAAGIGSTDVAIEFEPLDRLEVGRPVILRSADRDLLYQVSRVKLVSADWAGSAAVVPHATARQIGVPRVGFLKSEKYLPEPHEPVFKVGELVGELPAEYHQVGTVKTTDIRIGIEFAVASRGHLAILGMSGTGKTAVARRIATALGATRVVVALDTTGEYRSRLAVPAWTAGDFATHGFFVNEPAGDPPERAAAFVRDCMAEGNREFVAGGAIQPRVILLEEAHSFIPEGHIALRNQWDSVAYTTRMIMQARKFAVTFMIVSQRTAVVSKSGLSQCENYIILRTIDQTSLDYLETIVGPEMRAAIPRLERYEAICIGPAFNSTDPVIVALDPP